MTWLRFFRRKQADAELQQEIEAFIAEEISENMARGMSPAESRRLARIKFGNPQKIREDLWRQNSLNSLDSLLRDLRFAARTLRRTPGFAWTAVLVMAFGIGACVASFTIVRSVLLNPLPYPNSERLVRLYETDHTGETGGTFSEWRTHSQSFSQMGIGGSKSHTLSGSDNELPENVSGGMFSWSVLPTLGVRPALGRNFTADDDKPSANPTVLLSWGLWRRRFGGNPTILNQTIRLDAKSYTVAGVMPPWFAYPDSTVQLWTPIYYEERPRVMQDVGNHQFWDIGRLKPGVAQSQAVAELTVISRRVHDQHRDTPFVADSASASPLLESVVGDVKTPLYILLGASVCVLLIACLNIATLLVARSTARRKELSIRMALGGGQLHLLRQNLMESFLLSWAGGALGLLLAYGAIQWVIRARHDMARVEAIRMDGYMAAATVGLVVLCALLAGLAASFHARGDTALLATLQEASRANSAGRAGARLRSVLVSLEVSLTVVLLIAAGLLLKSYGKLRSANLGCLTGNVLKMDLHLPETRYPRARMVNFLETILSRVRSLPGIRGAGLIYGGVPGIGYGPDDGFVIVDHPEIPADQRLYAIHRWVDPGYFSAVGIPIRRGHTFDWNQQLGHATEVIISELFARRYFPGEDPLGKRLRLPGGDREIVAVAGDTRFAPGEAAEPVMYSGLLTDPARDTHGATLVARSDSDVTPFAIPIQRLLWQQDRDVPASDILTLDQVVGRSTLNVSFDAFLLAAFAGMSLLLAAVGLFGMLSYVVLQRTSEMGIRIALGAQRKQLLQLVLVDGLRPAFIGLALGLAAGAGLTRLIRSILYQTEPLDPVVLGVAGFLLLVVATAACVIPAWRASQLDPRRALRAG